MTGLASRWGVCAPPLAAIWYDMLECMVVHPLAAASPVSPSPPSPIAPVTHCPVRRRARALSMRRAGALAAASSAPSPVAASCLCVCEGGALSRRSWREQTPVNATRPLFRWCVPLLALARALAACCHRCPAVAAIASLLSLSPVPSLSMLLATITLRCFASHVCCCAALLPCASMLLTCCRPFATRAQTVLSSPRRHAAHRRRPCGTVRGPRCARHRCARLRRPCCCAALPPVPAAVRLGILITTHNRSRDPH